MAFKDGMWGVTACLWKSKHVEIHSCHNAWRKGSWYLLVQWGCSGHFEGKKSWRILLQFDKKIFDGQWDEIQGIFQSWRDIFHFILSGIMADTTKIKTKIRNTTTNHQNRHLVITRLLRVAQKSRFGCRCRTTQQNLRSTPTRHACAWKVLLRAESRSSKRHCVVVKKQGF